jgi:hypothetical protein
METGPQNNNAPPVERIPLSRARIYSEFLGKEHEREAIRSFIAELPTAYDLVITDRRAYIKFFVSNTSKWEDSRNFWSFTRDTNP